ncbi:glycosyltransferase family 2 protein [Marinilabilia sp.]|uniref:glycosyltransferase family 2 protein n=1 Tax=Marinilabilia sp. TaxID=2021252 RepID=UPI0025BA7B68|nr:glycosyltransferase family 2 protein [Marinilabilia sp.]
MPEPTIAIVILNWNTRSMLERFLPDVLENSKLPGATVVVADNGSNDGSGELIKQNFPEVKLLQLNKNYGFAGGYNRALNQIDATYSVLLNSDVIPGPNWLEPLVRQLENHPNCAACVPKIKDLNHPEMFEYAGAAGGFIDKWGYPFCRGRIFDRVEKDHGQYNKPGDVFWGSGAALMVRTKEFNQSGGLDEHFFAHMEEIDWCWRIKNQGMTIAYIPKSTIFHLGGGTLNAMSSHKTYLNFRNNLFMLYRNLPQNSFQSTIFVRLMLDGIAAIKFLVSGEWKNTKAVFRAHRDYFKRIPQLKKERLELQNKTTVFSHKEIYPNSLILDFFIRGRKKFSDLNFFR